MTALELANELDKSRQESYTSEHLVGKATSMLRAQQTEIEALKEALRMKVILNEHVQDSMKEYKELLK
jgi:hypothetical protein